MTVSIDRQVAAGSDDCYVKYLSAEAFYLSLAYNWAGSSSSSVHKLCSGHRFLDIQVPIGATITAAYLEVRSSAANATTGCKTKIRGELVPNPATFLDLTDWKARFPANVTTAEVAWDIPAWDADTWYGSDKDISAVIQEIIDQPGWVPGNPVVIFWDDYGDLSTEANKRSVRSQEYTGNVLGAKLHIEYTIPATLTRVKTGVFAKRTSTGSQQITGIGFKPKLLLLYGVAKTADGFTDGFRFGFGASYMNGETPVDKAIAGWSADARSTYGSDTDKYVADKAIAFFTVAYPGGTPTAKYDEADLTTLDDDGFTLNWTTVDNAVAWVIHYVAIAGDDVECQVAAFDALNTITGEKTYTHVNFKPELLLLFSAPNPQYGGFQNHAFGFADGDLNQFAMCGASEDSGQNPTNTARYQRTTKCFASLHSTWIEAPDHVESEASLVSMEDTGFKLNWSTAAAYTQTLISVAIRGIQAKVGAFNAPGDAADHSYTGVGFKPRGALFAGFNKAASTSIEAHNRFSIGAADTPRSVGAIYLGDTDNISDDTHTNQATDDGYCYLDADYDDPAAAKATALVKTWDADGFTLTWGGIYPYPTPQVGYLLLGDYAPAGDILWGEAALSASGSLAASGRLIAGGTASLSAGGVFTSAARLIAQGTASLSGSGTMAAVGKRVSFAAAALSATGTLAAAGRLIARGAAVLSAAGSLSATGRLIAGGSAILSATGNLVAEAFGVTITWGAAALSGSSNMVAKGRLLAGGSASLSGSGTLTATARRVLWSAATLSASGTLTAAGKLVAAGKAVLSASGSMSALASGGVIVWGAAVLSGATSLVANGRRIARGSAALTSVATMTAAALRVRRAAAALSGTANLTGTGFRVRFAAATLAGTGSMTAVGRRVCFAAASLVGSGMLTAVGRAIYFGRASFQAIGTLVAVAIGAAPTVVKLRASTQDTSRLRASDNSVIEGEAS